uniref:Uncharacterized protein n=1 Tax=Cacopsylla melanoneura TaxID=428564 RepID=A0A8D8TLA3_9HEMI
MSLVLCFSNLCLGRISNVLLYEYVNFSPSNFLFWSNGPCSLSLILSHPRFPPFFILPLSGLLQFHSSVIPHVPGLMFLKYPTSPVFIPRVPGLIFLSNPPLPLCLSLKSLVLCFPNPPLPPC